MQDTYNVVLRDESVPLLVSERGRGHKVCKLPAELCFLTGNVFPQNNYCFGLMNDSKPVL